MAAVVTIQNCIREDVEIFVHGELSCAGLKRASCKGQIGGSRLLSILFTVFFCFREMISMEMICDLGWKAGQTKQGGSLPKEQEQAINFTKKWVHGVLHPSINGCH